MKTVASENVIFLFFYYNHFKNKYFGFHPHPEMTLELQKYSHF